MTITYTWQTTNLERKTEESGLNDVVFKVSWTYTGVDSENDSNGNPYRGSFSDATLIGSPDPDNFTAFANVTKDQCKAWVLAVLAEEGSELAEEDSGRNEDTLKAKIDAQIERKKSPPEKVGVPDSW